MQRTSATRRDEEEEEARAAVLPVRLCEFRGVYIHVLVRALRVICMWPNGLSSN